MKAINKDIFREILKTKAKFISIMIIMFLGVFIFVGLKETSPTMENTYNKHLEKYNFYDLRVTHNFGISDDDLKVIKKLDNISELEKYYIKKLQINNNGDYLNVESLPEELATPKITSGQLPKNNKEIALVESLQNKYKIGDTVTFNQSDSDENKLKETSYKLVGFVQGADHIEISNHNLANKDYFGYVTKENFSFKNATGVNIKLTNIKYKYSDKNYIEEVNKSRYNLIEQLQAQQKIDEKNYLEVNKERLQENEQKIIKAEKTLKGTRNQVETLKNVDINQYNQQIKKITESELKIKENKKQLNVAKKSLENETYPRFNVENIRGLKNYAQFIDSAASLTFVANVFSIFLFVVSILVSLTTLTRMIDENRINIGTLKSLGYSNWQISKKYYVYGVLSTLIGTILGIIGAYLVIVPVVYNSYARFFTLNKPILVYSPLILISAFGIAVGCIILSIFIPLRKNLKEKSAYLLRPKAPSGGSRIFLEKISFIWKRLTFLRKVTFRNIFRYKIRMLMTIFGVTGCLALMFIGFGIRYGVIDISNEQFKVINRVDIAATYNPYIDEKDVDNIQNEINNNNNVIRSTKVNMQLATIEKNHEILDSIQMLTLDESNYKDYISLKDNSKELDLPQDSAVINEKLAYLHKLNIGDNFSVIVNDKEYSLKVGAINKNYFGHTIYINKNYYETVFGKKYQDNTFLIKTNENSGVVEDLTNTLKNNKDIVGVSDNSKIQETLDNFIKGIDIIVVVMVLCSLTLALVVLYNLINVNVSERIRELSTIKVLGFYPKEVTIYVFREIFYLSGVGIILGNYLGYRLYLKIILELAGRNMMFSSRVPVIVYALATGVTILITIVVTLIMHRKLKKVNMVEALKAIE
ncbi:efflux ABC transporter, permease protein [Gemella bergeri ATCC 700627]|uniref:Efflux ABC transporter, permease protein n=1 Tax=Gemella bergeri ATCC 700627 TaxID=1321820 RepID=U2QT47_9BACL|nr:FtsX-like permease family protein [Gemella bergeri]ERK59399.1 efflux ABC transporter, permease protein [Gemella bergeri ATCC 700627]